MVLRFPKTRRLGKAMRGLALVVAALTCPVCSKAIAGEWIQDSVSSTTTGTLGTVAKLSGRVDDPRGSRPAELVITCADNRTSVFVSADYLVFGGDAARVDYAIDNAPRSAPIGTCVLVTCASASGMVLVFRSSDHFWMRKYCVFHSRALSGGRSTPSSRSREPAKP